MNIPNILDAIGKALASCADDEHRVDVIELLVNRLLVRRTDIVFDSTDPHIKNRPLNIGRNCSPEREDTCPF